MPKKLSPERRHLRARIARAARYGEDQSEFRNEYRVATAAQYIEELIASAPPLTDEQIARLRALLPPVGDA